MNGKLIQLEKSRAQLQESQSTFTLIWKKYFGATAYLFFITFPLTFHFAVCVWDLCETVQLFQHDLHILCIL
jgi:hypothetical protein